MLLLTTILEDRRENKLGAFCVLSSNLSRPLQEIRNLCFQPQGEMCEWDKLMTHQGIRSQGQVG